MLALKTCCWQQFYIFKFIINRKPPSLLFSVTRPHSVKNSSPSRFALRWYVFTRVVWWLRTGTRVVFLLYQVSTYSKPARCESRVESLVLCASHVWITSALILRQGSDAQRRATAPFVCKGSKWYWDTDVLHEHYWSGWVRLNYFERELIA